MMLVVVEIREDGATLVRIKLSVAELLKAPGGACLYA
jgi:hypothetical protein